MVALTFGVAALAAPLLGATLRKYCLAEHLPKLSGATISLMAIVTLPLCAYLSPTAMTTYLKTRSRRVLPVFPGASLVR